MPLGSRGGASSGQRIGIFGGTFDPIHIGHLILCQEAHYQLALDQLLLLPAADPPHKQDRYITPIEHRLQMIEQATEDVAFLTISRVDIDRPGPHYSVDTIQILQKQFSNDTELFFLIGLDSLRDLPTWHRPEWLIAHCQIVTFERGGTSIEWPRLEEALPGIRSRVQLLQMPELEISSSDIRQRVHDGRPTRYHVLPTVESYIAQNDLYT